MTGQLDLGWGGGDRRAGGRRDTCPRCGSEYSSYNRQRRCLSCRKVYERLRYRRNLARSREGGRVRSMASWHRNRETRIGRVKERRRAHFFRYRSWLLKFQTGVEISPLSLWGLFKSQRGRCALTGRKLEPRTRNAVHLDHVIPKSKEGSTSLQNVRWVCGEANMARQGLSDRDFLRLCSQVVLNVLPDDEPEVYLPVGVPDFAVPEWWKGGNLGAN